MSDVMDLTRSLRGGSIPTADAKATALAAELDTSKSAAAEAQRAAQGLPTISPGQGPAC